MLPLKAQFAKFLHLMFKDGRNLSADELERMEVMFILGANISWVALETMLNNENDEQAEAMVKAYKADMAGAMNRVHGMIKK